VAALLVVFAYGTVLDCFHLMYPEWGRERKMNDVIKDFVGKTLRICTHSGAETYIGVAEMIKDDCLVLKSRPKEDRTYIAISAIESFKEEEPDG
jgi:hypothetical protein